MSCLIDSPGGDPTLAQRINARLRYLRSKNPDVRVVAACERMCASAAYMIAIQADEVIAGPYSLVGSIGAVITAFNVSEALAKLGVQYKAYGSGTSKAMLNPFVPATPGDEAKARQLVETLGAFRPRSRRRGCGVWRSRWCHPAHHRKPQAIPSWPAGAHGTDDIDGLGAGARCRIGDGCCRSPVIAQGRQHGR